MSPNNVLTSIHFSLGVEWSGTLEKKGGILCCPCYYGWRAAALLLASCRLLYATDPFRHNQRIVPSRCYRGEKKSLQILLSYSQAGPGRKAKQDQEDISRNHVPRLCKQRPTPRLQRSLLMARARETQYSRLCYSLLLSFSIPNSYPG